MPVITQVRRSQGALPPAVTSTSAGAVALLVRPGEQGPVVGTGAGVLGDTLGDWTDLDPGAVLAAEGAEGSAGEVVALPVDADGRVVRCLLVGVGDRSPAAYRRAGAALARRLTGTDTAVAGFGGRHARPASGPAATWSDEPAEEEFRAFVEGLLLASYTFTVTGDGAVGGPRSGPVGTVHVVTPDDAGTTSSLDAALAKAVTGARAVAFARDLINTPPATKSPQWLVEQAEHVAERAGLGLQVRAEAELRAEGFGGILAVGAGSARPPRLIELVYEPADSRGHVVLVGKGITFDSGGLSLKPNDDMKLMKTDMAGGGVVLAVLSALRDLRVPYRVTGLIAAAENMPSGSAQRPGDVITHHGGRTVEVFNTDAEGRLVLADALAYASERLAAKTIVDLATLTGAATVALGRTHGALYATDDSLARELLAGGELTGEELWRMPLVDDYRDALDSDVADLSHIARGDYGAGSVVAALFLREFTGQARWAHLDIAGPARAAADEYELTKGGTGFGVRALLRWLE